MVDAIKQRLDGIGERRGVKAQKHLNRLGEFYKLYFVDGIFHSFVEPVSVWRICGNIFGIGKYHVA
ncbi:hypothetical protein DXA64_08760 [Collinsella sp. OF03-4AA]|nr:hypothetical protein DXA64_08760 [Collinsella sp. OF03-4AA]